MDHQQRAKSEVMPSAMIGATLTHAKAMITWLKLDPKLWRAVAYGQSINGARFMTAMCIRPISGVTPDHAAWLAHELRPAVRGDIIAYGSWAASDVQETQPAREGPQLARSTAFD